VKKFQSKFRKVREEINRWDELQSCLISQFRNASHIVDRFQVIWISLYFYCILLFFFYPIYYWFDLDIANVVVASKYQQSWCSKLCQWHERCSFGEADWIAQQHFGFHEKDFVSFYCYLVICKTDGYFNLILWLMQSCFQFGIVPYFFFIFLNGISSKRLFKSV